MTISKKIDSIVDELKERLRVVGLPTRAHNFATYEGENYCTVTRIRLKGEIVLPIYLFVGPYFGGAKKIWVGFGSASVDEINRVRQQFAPDEYADLPWAEWSNYKLSAAKMSELRKRSFMAYEDYRDEDGEVWFGKYIDVNSASAAQAADFIDEVAGAVGPFRINQKESVDDGRMSEKVGTAKLRLIHSKFSAGVRLAWRGRCAVTGVGVKVALRASHIAPWSTFPKHRGNPDNGLLLVANLDALFDRGLISFRDDGRIILSKLITSKQRNLLALNPSMKLRRNLTNGERYFLRIHRRLYRFSR